MATLTRRALLLVATLSGLPAAARAAPRAAPASAPAIAAGRSLTEEDGPVRFSLPTESDQLAWTRPGFRFGLGFGYGRLVGLGGAPDGNTLGPTIRLGLRLDQRWSLLASFQYLYAFGENGVSGLRYVGTLEPTWHLTRRLSLAVGLGFGGIVGGADVKDAPEPPLPEVSHTFPDAHHPIRDCSGVGVVGLLRADYLLVIGPRASTGLTLQTDLQWTGCVDEGYENDDTAEPIVTRQWWPHFAVSTAWIFLWR